MSVYPSCRDVVLGLMRNGAHPAACQVVGQAMTASPERLTRDGDIDMMAMDVARVERHLQLVDRTTGERRDLPPMPNPFEPAQAEHAEWETAIARCRAALDAIDAAACAVAGVSEKETADAHERSRV